MGTLKNRPIVLDEIKAILIAQLTPFWSVGVINTPFEVVSFAVGYFGYVDEDIHSAILALVTDGYISY